MTAIETKLLTARALPLVSSAVVNDHGRVTVNLVASYNDGDSNNGYDSATAQTVAILDDLFGVLVDALLEGGEEVLIYSAE